MNKLIGMGAVLVAYCSVWAGAQENDLMRLAKSGVDTGVLSSYIEVAKGPYHFTADQIIELKNLGVPPTIVSQALRHEGNAQSPEQAPEAAVQSSSAGAAPDSATVSPAAPPPEVVYPYPYPYSPYYSAAWYYDYGYWPYVSLGWGWGPSYWGYGGYWGGHHGHYYNRPGWHGSSGNFRASASVGYNGMRGSYGIGAYGGVSHGGNGWSSGHASDNWSGGHAGGGWGGGHGGGHEGGGHGGGGHR